MGIKVIKDICPEDLEDAKFEFECHVGFMVKTKSGVYVEVSPSDFVSVTRISECGRPYDHSVKLPGIYEMLSHILEQKEQVHGL